MADRRGLELRRALCVAAAGQDPSVLDELAGLVVGVQQAIVVQSRAGTPIDELRALARTCVRAVADRLGRAGGERSPAG